MNLQSQPKQRSRLPLSSPASIKQQLNNFSDLSLRSNRSLSSSFRLIGRSRSSVIRSDSVPSESARFTAYERLSESMRLADEPPTAFDRMKMKKEKRSSRSAWGLISKVFSFRKSGDFAGGDCGGREAAEVKRKRKLRSSWLPDPDRRWPVQGWS